MKHKLKIRSQVFVLFIILVFYSCEKDFESPKQDSNEVIQTVNDILMIDGTLHINSKASLQNIINKFKISPENQNEFNLVINNLENKGFRPLTPNFDENDSEKIQSFVKRKIERLEKRNIDYGVYSRIVNEDPDIDLDDELIFDPAFASLLNEDREIFVGDKFYKYTEMGMFFCESEKELILKNYLDNLTPQERIQLIQDSTLNLIEPPCGEDPNAKLINSDIKLFQPNSLIQPCDGTWIDDDTDPIVTTPPGNYAPPTDLIKQNLPVCEVQANSLYELVFGPSEGCIRYMNNDRRVKTKFWKQNYFIFSSLGCKVKFQKHVENFFASWWEKSFAEKLELGVNYITYEYNFNVPMFNQSQYNYETTFFEYNGTKYNVNGQIINTIPTGVGNFVFDTTSTQSIMNIYIFGQHIENSQINKVIDEAAKQCVNGIQDIFVRNGLINKMQTGQVKYNLLNAVPFANKVKFATTDVKWTGNDSHVIINYFDFNFLFTWKSSYSGTGDYLQGLNGATDYTNVTADVYGAAYNLGQWEGSRLKYTKSN